MVIKKSEWNDLSYQHGIVDFDGKTVLDFKYNEVQKTNEANKFVVGKFIAANKTRYGLCVNNKQVIDFKYPSLYWNHNQGVAKNVIYLDKMDKNGNIVHDWKNYSGVIDEKGDTIIPFIHNHIHIIHLGNFDSKFENKYWYSVEDTLKRTFVLDENLKILNPLMSEIRLIDYEKGIFTGIDVQNITYIFNYKNEILAELKNCGNPYLYKSLAKYGLFVVKTSNKGNGIIDSSGNWILEPQSSKISNIFELK